MNAVNPGLWWLLLLAVVPLLIHLLIRQRIPRVRWAAMTFLLAALRKNRKKLLLETLLLLLVRTAIVVALAIVVVRPVVRAAWSWLAPERQRAVGFVVLDDSASMAASDGLRTRFARALARVEQYLDALPAGSEVCVLLAGNPPEYLVRARTRDLGYVRDRLAPLAPRDGEGAIAAALDLVRQRFAEEQLPNREIVIVTDTQGAEWQEEDTALAAALTAAAEQAPVLLLSLPETSPANLSISDLSVTGGPQALIPGLATTRWPSRIDVELTPHQLDEELETAVELLVDGRKVARQTVRLRADEPTRLSFSHRFVSPGEHVLTARCEPDRFVRDDARSIVVNVVERVPVLLVDGRHEESLSRSATGFLRIALWPTSPDDPDDAALVEPRAVSAGGLGGLQLSDFALIVLADVPALPTALLQQLKAAVRKGTGLLVVAGPGSTAANLSAMFADGGSGPLPVTFAGRIDLPPDAEPVGLVLRSPLPPALAGFSDPQLARALAQCGWHAGLPVAEAAGPATETWGDFSTGGAALVANTYGRGRVVYVAAPMDRQGGEFPLSPAFVPFVQQLALHLTQGAAPASYVAGESLRWAAAAQDASLVYPDSSSEPASLHAVEDPATGEEQVVLAAAPFAGVYTLRIESGDGAPRLLRRAVNVPLSECDLRTPGTNVLRGLPLPASLRLVAPDASLEAALYAARSGAELSGFGLLVLLLLVALELLLVRWFSPKAINSQAMLEEAMRL